MPASKAAVAAPARELVDVADYHRNVSMYASQATTWAAACSYLLKLSGEAFAKEKDEDADLLRDLANEWKPKEAQARDQQALYQASHQPDYEALAKMPKAKPAKDDKRYPTGYGDYYGVLSMYTSEADTWSAIIEEMLKRAGQAFARGQGKEAHFLRSIAKDLKPTITDIRSRLAEYQRRYRPDPHDED